MTSPRKPNGQGIKFVIDMEPINQFIGLGYATAQLGTGSRYLQNNIAAAFGYANDEFKREITSTAAASGKYNHMFEWGTQGINTAKTNMRPKANSEQARLWHTFIVQNSKSTIIDFAYKKSVAIVPKPTVGRTGIPTSVTSKLSDHVFWNKAKVMETGQTVKVTRVKSDKLFIPLAYAGITGPKSFVMVPGPTNPTPGVSEHYQTHKGTFTEAFKTFWEGRGSEMMQEQTELFFQADVDKSIESIRARKPGRWTPPNATDMNGRIIRHTKTFLRLLETAAEERKAANGQ